MIMHINDFDAVLFDMDGVILDSMTYHAQTWQELFRELGLEVSCEFVLLNEGALGPEPLLELMREQGLEHQGPQIISQFNELFDRQVNIYIADYAPKVKPYPHAAELLRQISGCGLPAALVTSSRKSVVQNSLGKMMELFKAIVSADDVVRHKPFPDPYLAGARALGCEPSRCLVVENAPAGIKAALAAGATCFAVSHTLPARHLSQAHAVFPDLEALAGHLGCRDL
jgi:beta-phosphoglucomutase